MSDARSSAGLSETPRPQSSDAVRCWRCMELTAEARRIDHPDPAADTTVPVCADGCWLPEPILYRCHDCGDTHDYDMVHLVWLPDREALAPECLDCDSATSE